MTSDSSTQEAVAGRRRLARILIAIFAIALVMGPGPGIYLINPDSSDPQSPLTWFGMPRIYVWAIFWFGVQVAVLIVANFKLWRQPEAEDTRS